MHYVVGTQRVFVVGGWFFREQFLLILICLGIEDRSSLNVIINYIVFLGHVSPLFFWLQYDYFIHSPGQRIVALNQSQKAHNS